MNVKKRSILWGMFGLIFMVFGIPTAAQESIAASQMDSIEVTSAGSEFHKFLPTDSMISSITSADFDNINSIYYVRQNKLDQEFDTWMLQFNKTTGNLLVAEAVDNDSLMEKRAGLGNDIEPLKLENEIDEIKQIGKKYLTKIGFDADECEIDCLLYFDDIPDNNLSKLIRLYYISEEEAYEIIFVAETKEICTVKWISSYDTSIEMELLRAEKQVSKYDGLSYQFFSL